MWGGGAGGGGESERRGSEPEERLLDLDEREGVRGSDENRFRLTNALNALGASDPFFSSSDPLRTLLGGRDGSCDTLEHEDAADTDGERDRDAARAELLPLGEECRLRDCSLRLTQLPSLCKSSAGRRSGDSSCWMTTRGWAPE